MVSGVYCRDGPWIGERGYGEMIQKNRPKGNFSKKQQARVMEHVSMKPNERRKKLSLLQMQRGEVIKCRQIWQGSQRNAKMFLLF